MYKLAAQYLGGANPQKVRRWGNADVCAASVINQKSVNQNAQQILVLVALQVLNLIEAQFGVATNEDQDVIG
jgi:hypothetical protein